jgi:hypothetical protein
MNNNLTFVTIISITSKIIEIPERNQNQVYTIGVIPGVSDEQTLEIAWDHTNLDNRPHGRKVCSSSVGDIFILNGQHWFCNSVGFVKITPEQSFEVQQLTSRDVMFGLEWLIEKGLVTQ